LQKYSPAKKNSIRTAKLKRLESVDEAFSVKFAFHPALRSREAERRYVRSLTKIILLCSCTKDVVNAPSAQLFFVEVLSTNVLLPVIEMLSMPDRIYEIIIRLTYDDSDAILDESALRELIDLEVKRMQLIKSPTASSDCVERRTCATIPDTVERGTAAVQVETGSKGQSEDGEGTHTNILSQPACDPLTKLPSSEATDSSQIAAKADGVSGGATGEATERSIVTAKSLNSDSDTLKGKDKLLILKSDKNMESGDGGPRNINRASWDGSSISTSITAKPESPANTAPTTKSSSSSSAPSSSSVPKPVKNKSSSPTPLPDSETKSSSGFSLHTMSEVMERFKNKSRSVSPDMKQSSQDSEKSVESQCDGETQRSSVSERNSSKGGNTYGDIVSTGLPSVNVKPKLQVSLV
jgi:hypothetical protein